MNGYRPFNYGASRTPPPPSGYNGNNVAESFGKEGLNGSDKVSPRFDLMNTSQARIMSLADLKDPIQVHLLTETALSDSKEYEILSQEEVDRLKKQTQTLSQRVDSTRSNLAIQSKYRDAAVSLAKLYATGKSDGDIKNDQHAREAELERETTEKQCEELSRELFELEKRLMIPQRRLLRHTAGILQLTHKASKKKSLPPTQINNGIPGSPESLYTYSNGRDSMGPPGGEDHFDDPGMYQMDPLEGLQTNLQTRQARKNVIEIPLKSPVREQANQLRVELDKAREENLHLIKTIADMEQKLQALNISLRETIVRFNPEVNGDYLEPPNEAARSSKPGDMLRSLVDYMETGLVAVQAEQESFTGVTAVATTATAIAAPFAEGGDHIESVLIGLWNRIQSGFAEIKQQREERRKHRAERGLLDDDDTSDDDGIDITELYSLTAFESRVQWLYSQTSTLKYQKSVLKRQIKQQRELNNKTDAEKDEEIERRQEELEQTRQLLDRAETDALDAQTMLSEALEDLEKARSMTGSGGAAEAELQTQTLRIESLEAEIEARITRIESLEAEIQTGSERMESLQAEIQTRSIRIESLETEVQTRNEKMESLQAEVQTRSARIESLEAEIQNRSAKIESIDADSQTRTARTASLEAEIEARTARIESLEAEIQARSEKIEAFATKVSVLETQNQGTGQRIAELNSQLEDAVRDKATAEAAARALQQEIEGSRVDLANKNKELTRRDEEMELLNMSLAELKTEVTIARAELDGAYGSRAERAADVAALKNNAEVVRLANHVERLKKELAGTVQDLQSITKETIGTERERMELEHKLDEALSSKTAMEADLQRCRNQVSKLQDDLDNERFKVVPGQGGTSRLGPGASMLSEQFRITMREERKKFQEEIKEERTKCRRLEDELNRLKRSQGPSKSPLNPRQ